MKAWGAPFELLLAGTTGNVGSKMDRRHKEDDSRPSVRFLLTAPPPAPPITVGCAASATDVPSIAVQGMCWVCLFWATACPMARLPSSEARGAGREEKDGPLLSAAHMLADGSLLDAGWALRPEGAVMVPGADLLRRRRGDSALA
jgi:hypothetical protein